MYTRHLTPAVLAALEDTPVVVLHGARQSGKSTLARTMTARHPAQYLTLDDATILAAARHDPPGFIEKLSGPVIIDEVQRVPELFLAIKAAVDKDRQPGRFLLTGSANILMVPRLADALVGRVEVLTLWPLSQGEIGGGAGNGVDRLFSTAPAWPTCAMDRRNLMEAVLRGGFPEAVARPQPARRRAWLNNYVTTLLQRDVRDLANIEGLTLMPRVLSVLASRAPWLLNLADLSRTIEVPQTTLRRYLALLEATFLVVPLPAWTAASGRRHVKSPSLLMSDTGVAAALLGADVDWLDRQPTLWGSLLENFVCMEMQKQCGWSDTRPTLWHYRTHAGAEVDLVLESPRGEIVGIEIKSAMRVGAGDLRGLKALAEDAGDRFLRGVVAYGGTHVVAFGDRLTAVPVECLWR